MERYWQAFEPWGDTQRKLQGGLARGRQKEGFKTAFEIEIVTEIEALLDTVVDEWDCEAIETAARCMAMRVAAQLVASPFINLSLDKSRPIDTLRL